MADDPLLSGYEVDRKSKAAFRTAMKRVRRPRGSKIELPYALGVFGGHRVDVVEDGLRWYESVSISSYNRVEPWTTVVPSIPDIIAGTPGRWIDWFTQAIREAHRLGLCPAPTR